MLSGELIRITKACENEYNRYRVCRKEVAIMAGRKSNAVKAAEAAAKAAEEAAKVEAEETMTQSIKKEEKKAETKAAGEKKETGKRTASKKAEMESAVHIQFAGKSYTEEDLMKMAKDVWKYDLKQKVGDLTNVELYVKPEESKVYYVFNGEFTGCYSI